MRFSAVILVLLLTFSSAAFGQFRNVDFTGVWKLDMVGTDAKAETRLDLKMSGRNLTGKLKSPHGEFPIENGWAEGEDLFFNVTIQRDEYKLKTTYRGHFFGAEIQFTVEAGERTLQVIGRRAE